MTYTFNRQIIANGGSSAALNAAAANLSQDDLDATINNPNATVERALDRAPGQTHWASVKAPPRATADRLLALRITYTLAATADALNAEGYRTATGVLWTINAVAKAQRRLTPRLAVAA